MQSATKPAKSIPTRTPEEFVAFADSLIKGRPDLTRDLSPAQMRVLSGAICGQSETEIAQSLHISKHTVHDHLKRIYSTFRICKREQLILFFAMPAAVTAPSVN